MTATRPQYFDSSVQLDSFELAASDGLADADAFADVNARTLIEISGKWEQNVRPLRTILLRFKPSFLSCFDRVPAP